MDDVAYEQLVERLAADGGPADAVADLILAVADGPDAVEAHLAGGATAARRPPREEREPASTPRVYLEEIAAEGFRGVGPKARLPLEPTPGLTLVVGRNGSGKSSFAEGLELLLTGQNLRWEGKTKIWKEGWRNLHVDGDAALTARFRLDGDVQPLVVRRSWPAGADLDGGSALAVSGPRSSWAELGWDTSLQRFRPILSYNELGAMFSSRASDLYDALSAVLGLEAFEQLTKDLAAARLDREKSNRTEKSERDELKRLLAGWSGPSRSDRVGLAGLAVFLVDGGERDLLELGG